MSELNIQLCPETGICSIIKEDGSKVDLMPDEVGGLRDASGDQSSIKDVLSKVDSGFAGALAEDELKQIAKKLGS